MRKAARTQYQNLELSGRDAQAAGTCCNGTGTGPAVHGIAHLRIRAAIESRWRVSHVVRLAGGRKTSAACHDETHGGFDELGRCRLLDSTGHKRVYHAGIPGVLREQQSGLRLDQLNHSFEQLLVVDGIASQTKEQE